MKIENTLKKLDKSYFDFLQVAEKLVLTKREHAGGPGALFYSGGWKGVAAFGYAAAKIRSAMLAAEFLVEHNDSEADR